MVLHLTDNPQNGELILGIVGAEANDISYFSNAFERIEVAINEANNFDPYRYLASNKHLMDVFGADISQATSHYNQYAKNENNTIMKFDEWIYMASNLDLVSVFNADSYGALIHYVSFGYKEGRDTNILMLLII